MIIFLDYGSSFQQTVHPFQSEKRFSKLVQLSNPKHWFPNNNKGVWVYKKFEPMIYRHLQMTTPFLRLLVFVHVHIIHDSCLYSVFTKLSDQMPPFKLLLHTGVLEDILEDILSCRRELASLITQTCIQSSNEKI